MIRTLFCVLIVISANGAKEEASKDEIVEHRVFGKEALGWARKFLPFEGQEVHPGCRKCSPEENIYCRGRNLLHDHCCCDRRHKEKFYFIPHVCYVKLSATCEPVATDCEEYARLYDCCCRSIVANRWKKFASEFALSKKGKRDRLISKMIALVLANIFFFK